jgi:hypothetical protein
MAFVIVATSVGAAVQTAVATVGSVIGAGIGALGVGGTTALLGGAASAYGQMEAGKAQQEAMEREAELRRLEAQTQELQRRQELNRRLAAEQVAMASGGIATEGTPASIALKSAEQIGISETTIGLSEALAERQLRRKGKVAASVGKTTAATSLLGTGTEIARIVG